MLSKSGHAVSLVGGVTVGGDGRTLVVGDKEVELKEYRGKPLLVSWILYTCGISCCDPVTVQYVAHHYNFLPTQGL